MSLAEAAKSAEKNKAAWTGGAGCEIWAAERETLQRKDD